VSTNIWDIDDVAMVDRNFGGCGDTPALTPPTISKSFAPAFVAAGNDSVATITLTNPNNTPIALSSDLIDTLPADLIATAATTTCGGTAGFTSATLQLASGATIPAEASCTLSGTVHSALVDNYVNTIHAGDLQTN